VISIRDGKIAADERTHNPSARAKSFSEVR
jgi:hypothetical protein